MNSEFIIEIKGYTDASGKESDNLELSTARALAVKTYLLSKGFPYEKVKILGKGVADIKEQDVWKNRRADILIRRL